MSITNSGNSTTWALQCFSYSAVKAKTFLPPSLQKQSDTVQTIAVGTIGAAGILTLVTVYRSLWRSHKSSNILSHDVCMKAFSDALCEELSPNKRQQIEVSLLVYQKMRNIFLDRPRNPSKEGMQIGQRSFQRLLEDEISELRRDIDTDNSELEAAINTIAQGLNQLIRFSQDEILYQLSKNNTIYQQ